ncbi:MAG: ribose 5-phosphate isomerase B [Candidatus Glassbacteria bacterium]|nr:ribose 5-phosphate isomerase B [Candidatus Glassbacteria bacterium]
MGEKIPIGSDHAGYELKEDLVNYLRELGFEPEDVGAPGTEPSDYPDFAAAVAGPVSRGERRRGVLICGTGIGMSISANRLPRVRAALAMNENMAEIARRHNDANILALGGRLLAPQQARGILKKFLETGFDGGRHLRRVEKIEKLGPG